MDVVNYSNGLGGELIWIPISLGVGYLGVNYDFCDENTDYCIDYKSTESYLIIFVVILLKFLAAIPPTFLVNDLLRGPIV